MRATIAGASRMGFLARHDPLTGLVNRAELIDALESRLSGAAGSVAVLFCDLDGFKAINDDLGHAGGDDLFSLAAQRLREVVMRSVPDAVVSRVGGDEFVAVIGGTGSAPTGAGLDALIDEGAADLVIALAQPFVVGDGQAQISISIGIALATTHDDADAIVKRADAAMYEAKANGRGRAVRAAP